MTNFDWTRYDRWENIQNSMNEPRDEHENDCECYLCEGYTLMHMKEESKIMRGEQNHESRPV